MDERVWTNRYKIVRRAMVVGSLLAAVILIDGFVLFLTNGLNSDAAPIFPWLGGVWASKNRSSGTGLLVMGALLVVVLLVGWFAYGRRVRARSLAEAQPAAPAGADPQPAAPNQRAVRQP